MHKYITSDLLEETLSAEAEASGIKKLPENIAERIESGMKIKRAAVENQGENMPLGRHSTIFTPRLHLLSNDEEHTLCRLITEELKFVLGQSLPKIHTLLVAGLGNPKICSDSLGVHTSEAVCVTRHMQVQNSNELLSERGIRSVCTLACGVLGSTGMRSLEVLRGAVHEIKPDCIIAVDALAARSLQRLGATVQISDSGITPGAGIGNRQAAINRQTLGVPVVAIGVPTLIGAATLVGDILSRSGVQDTEDIEKILEYGKGFFVAPKECDLICESAAKILAGGIDGLLEY